MHQLCAGCPFFDQTQIIYCALQPCACCTALSALSGGPPDRGDIRLHVGRKRLLHPGQLPALLGQLS